MEIFDIHHHLGSLTGGSLQQEPGWQDRDYDNRVRMMQANGVAMSAILAATGYIQADGIKDTMRCSAEAKDYEALFRVDARGLAGSMMVFADSRLESSKGW